MKKGASTWLISAKPTEKNWSTLKTNFLAVFTKLIGPLKHFAEAVNGSQYLMDDIILIDVKLYWMRTILALLNNKETNESFAVPLTCYFESTHAIGWEDATKTINQKM